MEAGRVKYLLQLLVLHVVVLDSIKLVSVKIPGVVPAGSQVILTCSYSVFPGEYIDSIKWYLNSSEIYRIVPGLTKDRVLTFPPGGLSVSLPQSGILKPGTHRLVINNASRESAGRYICQVTESRPPFKTEQAAARLQVLERPPSGPSISGLSPSYHLGSLLNVTCLTQPGHPPPQITWSLNGKQVPTHRHNISYIPGGLAVSSSLLLLRLSSSKMPSRLVVKCSSYIGQVYQEDAVGRAIFIRPSQPVLGEPLISGDSRDQAKRTVLAGMILVGMRL